MSWAKPRRRAKTGETMNEDWADAMRPYAGAIDGHLGEHNFKNGAFSSRTQIGDDAGLAYHVLQEEVDPQISTGVEPVEDTTRRLLTSRQWTPIPTSATTFVRKTVTTDRETLWVSCSFQALIMDASAGELWDGIGAVNAASFAIAVDGVVQLVGGVGATPGDQDIHADYPAPSDNAMALVVEGMVEVEPGSHVVELVGIMWANTTYTVDRYYEVFNHELIVRRVRA